ncbi:hypothetical protein BC829DRAFT_381569, partial [Chytridium lagenaria]
MRQNHGRIRRFVKKRRPESWEVLVSCMFPFFFSLLHQANLVEKMVNGERRANGSWSFNPELDPPELKKFEKNSFGDLLWVMRSPSRGNQRRRQNSELWTSGDLGLRPVAAFVQSNGDTMKFGVLNHDEEVTAAMEKVNSSRDGLINSLESGNAEAFEQSLEEFRKHSSAVATHKESIKIKMRQRQIDSNKERVLLSKLDDMERIPSLIRR